MLILKIYFSTLSQKNGLSDLLREIKIKKIHYARLIDKVIINKQLSSK